MAHQSRSGTKPVAEAPQKGDTAIYRGKEHNVSLLPKMEIEMVVPDEIVDEAIKAIIQAARTAEIGDGRVFVIP